VRRLAAIVSADVVGYSRLLAQNEAATLDAMKAHRRELWTPEIDAHGGRVVGTAGDSVLVEFQSAVAAVECSVAVQRGMVERNSGLPKDRQMLLRVGINIGEVVVDGEDIFGDGVNVAARLEALAEPGGVCASDDVVRQIRGRLDFAFTDGGLKTVKNIPAPVHVWHWSAQDLARQDTAESEHLLTLPDKPSIAVLPFDNMSGDPEQDYFSDGLTEDLITALSHIRWFFVIARNSTFAYKGRSVDVREVARELGVRYVLEGSVRKAGDRIRLTAQLIEGQTGNHVWAARYDRKLEDIFDLQDELTGTVVGAIEPELSKAEQARAKRKKPETLDSWDIHLRGMAALNTLTRESLSEAERTFCRVIEQDPGFAASQAGLAEVHYYNLVLGFAEDPDATRAAAFEAARHAVEHDREDAGAHCTLGRAHLVNRKFDEAVSEFQTALAINPSHALAHYSLGAAHVFNDKPEISLAPLEQAIRLSPQDANMGSFLVRTAQAHLYLRNHEKAAEWARKALRLPNFQWSRQMVLASALGHLGRMDEARWVLDDLIRRIPAFSPRYILDFSPMIDGKGFRHMIDGLRQAGLAE
jgi:adenylate cyclase